MIPAGTRTIMVDQATFDRCVAQARQVAIDKIADRARQHAADGMWTIGDINLQANKYFPPGVVMALDREGHVLTMAKLQEPLTATAHIVPDDAHQEPLQDTPDEPQMVPPL